MAALQSDISPPTQAQVTWEPDPGQAVGRRDVLAQGIVRLPFWSQRGFYENCVNLDICGCNDGAAVGKGQKRREEQIRPLKYGLGSMYGLDLRHEMTKNNTNRPTRHISGAHFVEYLRTTRFFGAFGIPLQMQSISERARLSSFRDIRGEPKSFVDSSAPCVLLRISLS